MNLQLNRSFVWGAELLNIAACSKGALVLCALCTGLLLVGCTQQSEDVPFLAVLGHAPLAGERCEPTLNSSGATFSLDVVFAGEYTAHVAMENRSNEPVEVTGAGVRWLVPENVSFAIEPQTFDINGVLLRLEPGQRAALPLELLDGEAAQRLAQASEFTQKGALVTVVATLSVEGRTVSGKTVQANALTIPLNLCHSCLLEHPLDALSIGDDGRTTCEQFSPGPQWETPCQLGQDFPVDCRDCRALYQNEPDLNYICDP